MDEKLLAFATKRQAEILRALHEHGSYRRAAEVLGVHQSLFYTVAKAVKKKAKLGGYTPEEDRLGIVPQPYYVKGRSMLKDRDGNIVMEWTKTALDRKQIDPQDLIAGFREAVEEITTRALPIRSPLFTDSDLMVKYVAGDPHIGMRAWGDEVGHDFDLGIATRDLRKATALLVASAPPAETALILQLGDFFHADDETARTPASKNVLDVDGRYAKVIRVGVRIMIDMIDCALSKHKRVIVRNNPGNHDPHSSLWLSLALQRHYANEPRVEIDDGVKMIWAYVFGDTLHVSTHGHTFRLEELPLVSACDFAEWWGQTRYRYGDLGHFHHRKNKTFVGNERTGMFVEIHATLATNDAYHEAGGYRSQNAIKSVTYHKRFGEVSRTLMDLRVVRHEQEKEAT